MLYGFTPTWYDPHIQGHLQFDTTVYTECSGICAALKAENLGYSFLIYDDAMELVNCIRNSDASDQGTITFPSVTMTDIEDMASAQIGTDNYIFIGDIGDNSDVRTTIQIVRLKEPPITGSDYEYSSDSVYSIICQYPAGNPPSHKDAEGLFYDKVSNKIYILTKRDNPIKIYSLAHQATYSGTQTLTYEGTAWSGVQYGQNMSGVNGGYCCGADLSADATKIFVVNPRFLYFWSRDTTTGTGQTIAQALAQTGKNELSYCGGGRPSSHWEGNPQGEAVCFDTNGTDYFTISEFDETIRSGGSLINYPLRKYINVDKTEVVDTFQQGYASYTGALDTYIDQSNPTTSYGTDATIIADRDYTTGQTSRHRVALLYFDISSIPANDTILGVTLLLRINAEGQDFDGHAMLSSWNESSTYNSICGSSTDSIDYDNTEATAGRVTIHGSPLWTENDHGYNTILDSLVICKSDSLRKIVSQWVHGTMTNYGIVLQNTHSLAPTPGDGFQFDSKEATAQSDRPMLIIRHASFDSLRWAVSDTGRTGFGIRCTSTTACSTKVYYYSGNGTLIDSVKDTCEVSSYLQITDLCFDSNYILKVFGTGAVNDTVRDTLRTREKPARTFSWYDDLAFRKSLRVIPANCDSQNYSFVGIIQNPVCSLYTWYPDGDTIRDTILTTNTLKHTGLIWSIFISSGHMDYPTSYTRKTIIINGDNIRRDYFVINKL